jgi:hypothetical protein
MIVAYGLGMGLLLTTLTRGRLALARGGLLRGLRSAMRWIDSVAGVLLILARPLPRLLLVVRPGLGHGGEAGRRRRVERRGSRARADLVAGWLNDRGAGPLALVLGIVTVAAIAAVVARRPKTPEPQRVRPDDGAALATAETPASDVR